MVFVTSGTLSPFHAQSEYEHVKTMGNSNMGITIVYVLLLLQHYIPETYTHTLGAAVFSAGR